MSEVRLIDANALKEDLRQYFTDGVLDGVSARVTFNQILLDIDNAPTVNAYTEEQVQEIREEVVKQFIDTSKRQKGEWIIVNQDNEGIHEIKCPFCHYSKGSDFSSILTVTFERFPPFCESCGADMRGGAE